MAATIFSTFSYGKKERGGLIKFSAHSVMCALFSLYLGKKSHAFVIVYAYSER